MNKLRAGIIGCGGIARFHQNAFRECGIEITAYADNNEEAARKLSAGEGAVFNSHQALLESGEVDLVAVCTPPAYHEDAATLALKRGIHVLCEKPLAHTVEASRRLAELAAGSEAKLMCAFRHRFIPAVRTIRSLLAEIGPVVVFQNTFCGPAFDMNTKWFSNPAISGGGCMLDTAAHSVDLFRFIVGEIRGSLVSKTTFLPDIAVEDAAVLVVQAESGAIGSLVSTWVSGTGVASIDIIGQNGRIVFDYTHPDAVRIKRRGEGEWTPVPVEKGNGFAAQTAHFARVIRGEEELACSAVDGLRSTEVIFNAVEGGTR